MDKRYLIDTNIIIYYLDNKKPANQIEFIESYLKLPSRYLQLRKSNYLDGIKSIMI